MKNKKPVWRLIIANPTRKKSAFTLIELAVVLIVIGIITLGIIKGTSLIRSSRIVSARSITAKSRISEVPGLMAWYESSMIESFSASQAVNAAQISEWRDISPVSKDNLSNKLSRSASSAVTYNSDGINNIPSVQFASGSFSLSAFYQGAVTQNTIFVVFRPTTAPSSTTMSLLDCYSGCSGSSELGVKNSSVWFNFGSGSGTGFASSVPSFAINGNYIIAAYFDGANSRAYVNNAANYAGGVAISPGSNMLSGLTVGTNKSGGTAFAGLISEIIIFDRILTIDERKSVMTYLSKKYKIRVSGL